MLRLTPAGVAVIALLAGHSAIPRSAVAFPCGSWAQSCEVARVVCRAYEQQTAPDLGRAECFFYRKTRRAFCNITYRTARSACAELCASPEEQEACRVTARADRTLCRQHTEEALAESCSPEDIQQFLDRALDECDRDRDYCLTNPP